MSTTSTTFAANLAGIRGEIAEACRRCNRSPEEVELMAVSKNHPVEALREAAGAGLSLFGENRVQEFQQKATQLSDLNLRVHLIGHLQSNKSARAVEVFHGIDSIDSIRLALRIEEAAAHLNRQIPVLLEIKLSPEETKTGFLPEATELEELLERLTELTHLEMNGLMTVPPYSEDPERARPYFRQLRLLSEKLAGKYPRLNFATLSMGMSGDFAVAIEEGSTRIRIGTALFGARDYSK
jgi:pyridoxal phosphate enzyme (YggS family)